MTSTNRLRLVAAQVLVVSTAAWLVAADSQPMRSTDLTVHEWGTFTSVAGEDGSAVDWDALGCKDDLPGFVNDYGYRGFKWRLRGTVRMETPVIYFYSPREVNARVKVAFPQGVITESYPEGRYEVNQTRGKDGSARRLETNLNGMDTSLRSVTGAIEWKSVSVQPHAAPALPVEEGSSRYYHARETDAASIAVGGQHERFLFYRGIGRFPVPLVARLSADGRVLVENRDRDAVPIVILFENRGGRLGYRNVGAVEHTITIDRPSLDGSFPQLRDDLEDALVKQGLYLKEARAMVETWRDSWFEEGTRLIYSVPSRSVEAILPLHIEPEPAQIARVFVGRIELVTPETTGAVQEALARSDWQTLDGYSRFLEPILKRLGTRRTEMTTQIEQFRRHAERTCGVAAGWPTEGP